jgi:hypothetical protein
MKYLPFAIAVSFILINPVLGADGGNGAVKEDSPREDCSRQTWPHFSPACLRDDKDVKVRMVTETRR